MKNMQVVQTVQIELNGSVGSIIAASGVEASIAQLINSKFEPFMAQVSEWQNKAGQLVVTDASQTNEMKEARKARLALKELRISANKARVALKEDSLKYSNLVQSIYNIIEGKIKPIEEYLQIQEDFVKIQEANRKAELLAKRQKELSVFADFVPNSVDLGSMSEDGYTTFFNGAKLQYEAKIEAEKKAEAERIAKAKAEAEEKERVRIENERLKSEAVEMERRMAKARAEAEAERKALEDEAKKARAEAEAKLKEEKAQREKIELELKAKLQAEADRKEQDAKAEAELYAASDMMKLNNLAIRIDEIPLPLLQDNDTKAILAEVKVMLDNTSAFIRKALRSN